ncbi:hypothetical protein J7E93_23885 [Streptomyces sp. ISL-36]|uniref:hypothetical protein n=1 Tax=Streptomyces sp. ISL-36 TaxID=2819182 RepID=UPI001BE57933|nr:hypothetical protein [Streptomyces sp. ISL-36]MBT2443088.1 hypothetical protein [Streptomyces sp. ISL-36]
MELSTFGFQGPPQVKRFGPGSDGEDQQDYDFPRGNLLEVLALNALTCADSRVRCAELQLCSFQGLS